MIAPVWPLVCAPTGRKGRGRCVGSSVLCSCSRFAPRAFADDLDVLRGTESVGPATFRDWTGFYFGGQFGYGDGSADFSNATRRFSPSACANGAGSKTHAVRLAGARQWHDPSAMGLAVLSATTPNGKIWFSASRPTTIIPPSPSWHPSRRSGASRRRTGIPTSVNIDGTGSVQSYGLWFVARARRLDVRQFPALWLCRLGSRPGHTPSPRRSTDRRTPTAPVAGHSMRPGQHADLVDYSLRQQQPARPTRLLYGFSVGGGLDVALTQNIFVRGEFEYIQFAPVSDIVLDDQRPRRRRHQILCRSASLASTARLSRTSPLDGATSIS